MARPAAVAKVSAIAVASLLASLLIVVVAALAWMLWTPSGTRFALHRVEAWLPADLTVGAVSGRLAGPLTLSDVHLRSDAMDATVQRLSLRWAPASLLRGRLEVRQLAVEGVRYRALTTEPQPEGEPFTPPERVELPVTVVVQHLVVVDVRAWTAPDAEAPLVVDRVDLAGRFEDARLHVTALKIAAPDVSARAEARVTTASPYPMEAQVRWRVTLPDYAPVVGTLQLHGTLDALELTQRVAAPYNLALHLTVADLLQAGAAPVLTARLAVDDLHLGAVGGDLPAARLSLDARARGPVDGLTVEAELSGAMPEYGRLLARARAGLTGEAVAIEHLELTQPDRSGRVEGRGRIALEPELDADLLLRWQDLGWPLDAQPSVRSPAGSLRVRGSLEDYRLALETRLEAEGQPSVTLEVGGEGGTEAVTLDLEAHGGGGRLAGRVVAAWAPDVELQARLEAVDLDPSLLVAELPGDVDATLVMSGRTVGEGAQVEVERLQAGGSLRQQPLSLDVRGRVAWQGTTTVADIDALSLALGGTELEASGRVAERVNVQWRLVSDDLSTLWPELAGSLSGSGAVEGSLPAVRLDAELEGAGLAFQQHRLQALGLRADLDLTGETPSSLRLALRDGVVAGTGVESVIVDGSGTPTDHRLQLALRSDAATADAVLRGRGEDLWGDRPAWHYALTEARLGYGELPPWQLAGVASGSISAEQLHLQHHCWSSSGAGLCVEGKSGVDGLAGRLEVQELAFDYFAALLPDDYAVSGTVSGSGQMKQTSGGVLTGQLRLQTTAGAVELPLTAQPAAGAVGEAVTVGLEPSYLAVDLDADGARAELELELEHGRLALAVTSPLAESSTAWAERALSGWVQLEIPDLAFAGALLPQVEELSGRVHGALTVEGSVAEPLLGGTLALTGGALDVPPAGLVLSDLSAELEGRGREGLGLVASVRSGGGELRVEGVMSVFQEIPTATIGVVGEAFRVVDTDEARIVASPDLRLEADAERILVAGSVRIPEAAITPGRIAPGAVTVSEDQVLVSEDGEAAPPIERPLQAEIRVILGDDVTFAGFGLEARLEGEVVVRQAPETPTTATGEIQIVEGEYRAYGQGLVIDSGRIYFAGGPVTEPALDVRAVRRPAEGILVGAQVEGTLEEPRFSLFSEPPMTQQEQLSWLVLGRSLEDAPGGEGDALARAALALGLRGGDFLAKNLGERLGVDQLTIQTGPEEAGAPSDPSEAALVAGKYLSPKLYVSYGIGLFNAASVLRMQYDIAKHWKLVTESGGAASGADLLFTIDTGG